MPDMMLMMLLQTKQHIKNYQSVAKSLKPQIAVLHITKVFL